VKTRRRIFPRPRMDNYIVICRFEDAILYKPPAAGIERFVGPAKYLRQNFLNEPREQGPHPVLVSVNDKRKVLIAPQHTTAQKAVRYGRRPEREMAHRNITPNQKTNRRLHRKNPLPLFCRRVYKEAVISNNSNAYSGAEYLALI